MLKSFLKDLWYSHATEETKEIRFQLELYYRIIFGLFDSFWSILVIGIAMVLLILCNIYEEQSQAILWGGAIVEIVILAINMWIGNKRSRELCTSLALKTYFHLITKRGEAITEEDFKLLKKRHDLMYYVIVEQECRGRCYASCFNLCKSLKKGQIEILAVRELYYKNEDISQLPKYTMHVIFKNNGWIFDTYSVRQYKKEDFYKIEEAKHCCSYRYEEIKEKSYMQFVVENVEKLQKWAKKNDCTCYLKEYMEKN